MSKPSVSLFQSFVIRKTKHWRLSTNQGEPARHFFSLETGLIRQHLHFSKNYICKALFTYNRAGGTLFWKLES